MFRGLSVVWVVVEFVVADQMTNLVLDLEVIRWLGWPWQLDILAVEVTV